MQNANVPAIAVVFVPSICHATLKPLAFNAGEVLASQVQPSDTINSPILLAPQVKHSLLRFESFRFINLMWRSENDKSEKICTISIKAKSFERPERVFNALLA